MNNNTTYACSYVEVLEILKKIPKTELDKIPKEKLEFYESNKDKNYIYFYNDENTIISKKAKAILINLYKNYIATENEKTKIEEILKLNDKKQEVLNHKKYNPDDLFINKKTKEDNYMIKIDRKFKWYEKLWDFIRYNILKSK